MLLAIEPFATNGQGQVSNGRSGNIYRVLRDRPLRDPEADKLFQLIKQEFTTLPFCERWGDRLQPNSGPVLRTLHRHGVISTYPVLIETKQGMVSQSEHTILVGNGRGEITTALSSNTFIKVGSFIWPHARVAKLGQWRAERRPKATDSRICFLQRFAGSNPVPRTIFRSNFCLDTVHLRLGHGSVRLSVLIHL